MGIQAKRDRIRQELIGNQRKQAFLVEGELPRYRRHGTLWKVVTALWFGLRALGFKEVPASEDSLSTAQDDAEIQRILKEWDALLDPAKLFADSQTQLTTANAATIAVQYAQWVHGKVYWQTVVNPVMNRLLGQMAEAERRKKILRKLPQPDDLEPILARLS